MPKFEKVSKYIDANIDMPVRKTPQSAGYDMMVAEDVIIPSYCQIVSHMETEGMVNDFGAMEPVSLNELASFTKALQTKPTLVSTGMKCKLEPNTYLELSVRSSCPLKYWLVMANSVGIIDADYYNNPDNEGEIFFQMINLSPFDIQLHKGDIIGQGIIMPYLITEDDCPNSEKRKGGFGSTSR